MHQPTNKSGKVEYKMLKYLQQNMGYIAIETVIVVGFMIALGVFAFQKFYALGQEQTEHAMVNVNKVLMTTTSGS